MSTDITMQDLELESAELLPSRETLWSGGNGDGSFLPILNGDAIDINVL